MLKAIRLAGLRTLRGLLTRTRCWVTMAPTGCLAWGGDDRLIGYDGNDVLEGGAGADHLEGGRHRDTVSYAGSSAAVTVNLATGTASGGDAQGDRLFEFENVRGSTHGDTLTGDSGGNRLFGEAGHDTLEGGAGADRLEGGAGSDTFVFLAANGNDRITDFTNGEDLIDLGAFGLSGFDALTTSSSQGNVTVDLTAQGGGTILLEGFDINDLDATDFVF